MDDVQIEEALSASDFSISASESNSDGDVVITNDESYESDTSSSKCIVLETNKNAEQYLKSNRISRTSRYKKWELVTSDIMMKFFGLLLWMGIVKYPSISDYWIKADRYANIVAPKVMSRNKGRLHFRQYIPSKRHRYGVKLFKVCGVNGFTYKIIIYEGNQSIAGQALGETIVLSLCEKYLDNARTIVTDNFYTSVPLAKKLLSKKTHLVGTLRKNRRYLQKKVTTQKLKKGEIIGQENKDGVVVLKF
ncbi:piggyBac transposable element-derived protein 4-like [Sipha flava]|uniref:PiggyBac transposable element-derived protein 4-like n=1 Tax=Sipha flava TaxID=143950 RepID=A0A8B8GDT7_9HEMI|nr:piggyBac transposable element-derived protein 4-like [Sipha flava]